MAGTAVLTDNTEREASDVPACGASVHLAAIRDIADTFGRPLAEVATLYRDIFTALAASASITDYLPVLVARKVGERYRTLAK